MSTNEDATLNGYIEAFRQLPTGNISDAMDELGVEGGVATGIQSINRDLPIMAGVVVTVQQGPRRPGAGRGRLSRHPEVMDEIARPGDVLVISIGGRVDVCSWGGILSLRAMKKGLAGVVIDGAARDVNEIIKSGFPVFTKGATPRASHLFLETLSVNQPLDFAGVHVQPGDIVIGDDTGVVFVPMDHVEAVLKAAQAIKEKEDKIVADLL